MICPNCNSLIDDNTKFCPECGFATMQNDNFNNFFTQDNNINGNYQNPQFSPQNNFDAAYPNNNYYNPQYAPVDPGEKDASKTILYGIISLFLGPLFAILSFISASKYKKTGTGKNADKIKLGKILSLFSTIIYSISIITMAVPFIFIHSAIKDLPISDDDLYVTDIYEIPDNTNNDWVVKENVNDGIFATDDFLKNLVADYDYYAQYCLPEEKNVYLDKEKRNLLLYKRSIPEDGEVVYNQDNIKLSLTDLYLYKDTVTNNAFYVINISVDDLPDTDKYTLSFNQVCVDNVMVRASSSVINHKLEFRADSNTENARDTSDIILQFTLRDKNSIIKSINVKVF